MKGSLHTDELMSAMVNKATGLRTDRRISHAFLFDLPRYHKLLALADRVVNITPNLKTKSTSSPTRSSCCSGSALRNRKWRSSLPSKR